MPHHNATIPQFSAWKCTRETCLIRYTAEVGDRRAERCPICHAPAEEVHGPYEQAAVWQEPGFKASGPELEVLFDNIRSAWNVGSMLRTADGAGVRGVHLCGVSATPDNSKVQKTALGAEKSLPWRYHPDALVAARSLREQGLRLWALEGGERSVSLFELEK